MTLTNKIGNYLAYIATIMSPICGAFLIGLAFVTDLSWVDYMNIALGVFVFCSELALCFRTSLRLTLLLGYFHHHSNLPLGEIQSMLEWRHPFVGKKTWDKTIAFAQHLGLITLRKERMMH